MGTLEERFFSRIGRTLIRPEDKEADKVVLVLKKALKKGDFILRSGMPTKYVFNLDEIY